ncbi:MAG: lysophospholipid acyltransferase family protein [bacterium]
MRELRYRLEVATLRALGWLFRLLPRRASLCIGEFLGLIVCRIGIRTGVAKQNLTAAFPEWDERKIQLTTKRCYQHFGALLVEFARLPLLKPNNVASLVDFENLEVLREALKLGKGGIVVSGHLGNWELMGAATAVLGFPVSYIVTSQSNNRVDALMDELRRSVGIEIIKRRDALKGVIKVLNNNRLIAILSDQDAHEAGVFVPFFGRLASTPRGAAMFALRTGAALIFVESYRQGTDRLKVHFQLISKDGLSRNSDEAVKELTRRFTEKLEEAVRRHPEQWFWMHRRWKTSPPE